MTSTGRPLQQKAKFLREAERVVAEVPQLSYLPEFSVKRQAAAEKYLSYPVGFSEKRGLEGIIDSHQQKTVVFSRVEQETSIL